MQLLDYIKALWQVLNRPDNDGVVVGLLIACAALLFTQVSNFFSCRSRLRDKDERIRDLVEERNKLQEVLLREKGIERKSSEGQQLKPS